MTAISEDAVLTAPEREVARSQTVKQGLRLDQEWTEDLVGGESRDLLLSLEQDQYVDLEVRQLGVDVWLELFDPRGERLARIDSPTGDQGSEELLWVAGEAGEYRLRIHAFAGEETSGRFAVRWRESRTPAEIGDRRRAAGAQALALGYGMFEEGQPRAALEQYQIALGHFESADSARAAIAWQRIGWMQAELKEKDLAMESYRQALDLFQDTGDLSHQAVVQTSLGRLLRSRGLTREAADAHRRAAELFRQVGDPRGEATAVNNLGVVQKQTGEAQGALESYRRSLSIWTDLGEVKKQLQALGNLGKLYLALGKVEEARDVFRRALALAEEGDHQRMIAIALNGLADADHRQGAYPRAVSHLERALTLWRQLKDRRRQGVTLNSLGTTHLKAGELDSAHDCYRQALRLFEELGDVGNQAITRLNIGRYHHDRGELKRAVEAHRQALPLYRQAKNRSGEASNFYALARSLHALGRLEAALNSIESALARVESLRNEPEGHTFRTAYFATKQDYWELAIDILMALDAAHPDRDFAARAFEASERRRSRSLLDLLGEAEADIRRDVASDDLKREAELRAELGELELRRLELVDRGADTDARTIAVEQRILALELDLVRATIRQQSPSYAELTEAGPVELATIQQQLLDRQTQLLVFSLGRRRSFLWLVSTRDLVAVSLPPRQEIEALAEEFYQQLLRFNERSRQTRALVAAKLSETILGPISGRLTARRLLVVSDGALQTLPFAALPVPGQRADTDKARYLIEDHEVINLPSASTLAVLRDRRRDPVEAPLRLAVIADPVYSVADSRLSGSAGEASKAQETAPTSDDLHTAVRSAGISSLERLAFSGEEAASLLAWVPEEQRLQAVGFDATRDQVLSGELENYRILHFATHGLVNLEQPGLSGLVLSLVDEQGRPQNGFVRLDDIYTLKLKADLVVLSACRTGLGQEVRGEGLIGLTRGFMFAGASRVLVSLWSVSDRSSAELMQRFYTRLFTESASYPKALREAQLSMLHEEAWQDPYHWAAFTLQGEWRGVAIDRDIGQAHHGGMEEDESSDQDLPLDAEAVGRASSKPDLEGSGGEVGGA